MERFILLFIVMLIFSTFILLSNVIGNNNLLASISGTIPNATLGTTPSATLGTIPNATPNTAQGTIPSATLDTTSNICSLITIYDNIKAKYNMDKLFNFNGFNDLPLLNQLNKQLTEPIAEATYGLILDLLIKNNNYMKYAQIILFYISNTSTIARTKYETYLNDNSNALSTINYDNNLEYINTHIKYTMLIYDGILPNDYYLFINCTREIFNYMLDNIAQSIRVVIIPLYVTKRDNFDSYFNTDFDLNDLVKQSLLNMRNKLKNCKILETTINYFTYLIYFILMQ